MKIALVDNEQKCMTEMAALASDFDAQHRCRMDTFSFPNAEEFLEAFEGGGFSAVFMDIYMDGIDALPLRLK